MAKGWIPFHPIMVFVLYALVLHSHFAHGCQCPSCRQMNTVQRCECCIYRQLGKRSGPITNRHHSDMVHSHENGGLNGGFDRDMETFLGASGIVKSSKLEASKSVGRNHESSKRVDLLTSAHNAPRSNRFSQMLNRRNDQKVDEILGKDSLDIIETQKRDEERLMDDLRKRSVKRYSFDLFRNVLDRDSGISEGKEIEELRCLSKIDGLWK